MNSRAWHAARTLATALGATLTGPAGVIRRWIRPVRECPQWCARDHRCTIRHSHPAGEHRSMPMVWRTGYGTLIATRTETLNHVGRVELRVTARLNPDDSIAARQAHLLATGADLLTRAVLAADVGQLRSADTLAVTR